MPEVGPVSMTFVKPSPYEFGSSAIRGQKISACPSGPTLMSVYLVGSSVATVPELGASKPKHPNCHALVQGMVSPYVLIQVEPILPDQPRSRMSKVFVLLTLPRNTIEAVLTGLRGVVGETVKVDG